MQQFLVDIDRTAPEVVLHDESGLYEMMSNYNGFVSRYFEMAEVCQRKSQSCTILTNFIKLERLFAKIH